MVLNRGWYRQIFHSRLNTGCSNRSAGRAGARKILGFKIERNVNKKSEGPAARFQVFELHVAKSWLEQVLGWEIWGKCMNLGALAKL